MHVRPGWNAVARIETILIFVELLGPFLFGQPAFEIPRDRVTCLRGRPLFNIVYQIREAFSRRVLIEVISWSPNGPKLGLRRETAFISDTGTETSAGVIISEILLGPKDARCVNLLVHCLHNRISKRPNHLIPIIFLFPLCSLFIWDFGIGQLFVEVFEPVFLALQLDCDTHLRGALCDQCYRHFFHF